MPRGHRRRTRLLLLGCLIALLALMWALVQLHVGRGRSAVPPAGLLSLAPPVTAERDPAVLPLRQRGTDEGPCAEVLGFLPHWVQQSNIRHDLLTDIACFAIEFHPDGTIKNAHRWPWLDAINRAHAAGVRIHITAQLFGAGDLHRFLIDRQTRGRFFHGIATAAVVAGAAGIVIDFEGDSSTDWTGHMPGFAAELRGYLAEQTPGVRLSIAVPAVNWGGQWDLAALAGACDRLVIMAYDYNGKWSERAGASAPLAGGAINVTQTIRGQYAAVAAQDPGKLILALPHYGNHWLVAGDAPGAAATRWVEFITFSAAQRLLESRPPRWDLHSQTPWIAWRDSEGWHQVWYEDARSFRLKLALAREAGLGGVGIWALGFAGDHGDLWQEIHRAFVAPCRCVGDLTGDGRVDGEDLHLLVEAYGVTEAGDLNADGVTDQADLLLLLDNYPGNCEE